MKWLTVAEAAARVRRSERTVYRWIRDGLLQKYELAQGASVIEAKLLEVDLSMRKRRGRPRKVKGSGA